MRVSSRKVRKSFFSAIEGEFLLGKRRRVSSRHIKGEFSSRISEGGFLLVSTKGGFLWDTCSG